MDAPPPRPPLPRFPFCAGVCILLARVLISSLLWSLQGLGQGDPRVAADGPPPAAGDAPGLVPRDAAAVVGAVVRHGAPAGAAGHHGGVGGPGPEQRAPREGDRGGDGESSGRAGGGVDTVL